VSVSSIVRDGCAGMLRGSRICPAEYYPLNLATGQLMGGEKCYTPFRGNVCSRRILTESSFRIAGSQSSAVRNKYKVSQRRLQRRKNVRVSFSAYQA